MSEGLLRVTVEGLDHHALTFDGEPLAEVNEFLSALKVRGLSPRTVRAYAYDLLLFYRWMRASNRTLRKLDSADLANFIAVQRTTGAAPKSINRRLSTARLLYRF